MKKLGFICSLIVVLFLVSLAFASWKGTGLRLGIATSGQTTEVRGVEFENGTIAINGTSDTKAGMIYYNSTDDKFYSCNSTGCSTFN